MSTQTPNFNFDLREGTDIFNPLSTNANWESLDTLLKNMEESGGIVEYTATMSGNIMKLSGDPVANKTIFKFVAPGPATYWTPASGGSAQPIYDISNNPATLITGILQLGFVLPNGYLAVIAWPEMVNAALLNGHSDTYFATDTELAETNNNVTAATQTAQAAATVANNALEVANKALETAGGMTVTTLWENSLPSSSFSGQAVTLAGNVADYKMIGIDFNMDSATYVGRGSVVIMAEGVTSSYMGVICTRPRSTYLEIYGRDIRKTADNVITFSDGRKYQLTGSVQDEDAQYCVPLKIYGIK